MILTDYFRSEPDLSWQYAKQCGVKNAVIRLPETKDFDITNKRHWETVYKKFIDFGVKPIIIEPLPNELHDHIKIGDEKRDECIEKAIRMMELMNDFDIHTICFNFCAHIGWTRTSSTIKERGGAFVTGFDLKDFVPTDDAISEKELWNNYEYFINAIIPYAEKYDVNLALHPDDPPLAKMGNVSRIMINADNIQKALNVVKSEKLGVTMCQATYQMMGEDLYNVIPHFKDKIKFIHFRNVIGTKENFRETFHDNGMLDMANLMKTYKENNIDVPIRVDHVPTMAGEDIKNPGYDAIGRLFAIGYLKGIMDAIGEQY